MALLLKQWQTATIILSSGHKNSNSSNVSNRHESYESRGAYQYVTIETLEASKRLGAKENVQHKARENARHKKCEVQEFVRHVRHHIT